MRLAIDVREAVAPHPTGKGRWTARFVTELLRRGMPLTLLAGTDAPASWPEGGADVRRMGGAGWRWHLDIARALPMLGVDAYVSPVSYIVPFLAARRFPVIPVVHDLIAFRGEPHDRKAVLVERCTLGRAVRDAAFTCAVSEATRRDLLARYPTLDPARVVVAGAGPSWEDAVPAAPVSGRILCIGTLCPRKNQLRLIRAFSALPGNVRTSARLTLVGGRGWGDAEIIRLAAETPGVEWKSYLPDAECRRLLSESAVFAFPSLYEGFGLPVLDALRAGVPVLTSARGSLAEVAGDACVACDPEDERSIAAGLERLLSDGMLRGDLARRGQERAAGFTWAAVADRFLEAASRIDKRPA